MKEIRTAILMLTVFTTLLGGLYPAVVTGIASALFPEHARGSLVKTREGRTVGSRLIGQPFSDLKYFWPRPSATLGFGYNPSASGGSNLGCTNPGLIKRVGDRVRALHDAGILGDVPSDLALASASGLDPHITPESAMVQISRIAKVRRVSEGELKKLVGAHIEDRQLGFLGKPRVNVLLLNLALYGLAR